MGEMSILASSRFLSERGGGGGTALYAMAHADFFFSAFYGSGCSHLFKGVIKTQFENVFIIIINNSPFRFTAGRRPLPLAFTCSSPAVPESILCILIFFFIPLSS